MGNKWFDNDFYSVKLWEMSDKEMIKYLRKQSKMWEKNCEVIGNKYLKLYVKYNNLKKKKG